MVVALVRLVVTAVILLNAMIVTRNANAPAAPNTVELRIAQQKLLVILKKVPTAASLHVCANAASSAAAMRIAKILSPAMNVMIAT
jgi:hypothetical protein